ncbi:protein BASIC PENTACYSTEINE6-like [Abeliophyllum distichum]|uniref:Protein BASIC PENTACYSTEINE6-like n=1 Tax=Abeliophyllum distichum TaxID=126358 RepID=A0ABD1SDK2_9LAMI
MAEAAYISKGSARSNDFNVTETASETAKCKKVRQPKDGKLAKSAKPPRLGKRGAKSFSKMAHKIMMSEFGGETYYCMCEQILETENAPFQFDNCNIHPDYRKSSLLINSRSNK